VALGVRGVSPEFKWHKEMLSPESSISLCHLNSGETPLTPKASLNSGFYWRIHTQEKEIILWASWSFSLTSTSLLNDYVNPTLKILDRFSLKIIARSAKTVILKP